MDALLNNWIRLRDDPARRELTEVAKTHGLWKLSESINKAEREAYHALLAAMRKLEKDLGGEVET